MDKPLIEGLMDNQEPGSFKQLVEQLMKEKVQLKAENAYLLERIEHLEKDLSVYINEVISGPVEKSIWEQANTFKEST